MIKLFSILIILSCSFSGKLFAQIKSDDEGNGGRRELRFIEDIEINRKNAKITSTSSKKSNKAIKIIPIEEETVNSSIEIEKSSSLQFKYAQLIDVEVENLKNQKLYAFMEEWMNTPYDFGGSDKSGIDCSSFSGRLIKDVYGLDLPRNSRQQYNSCDKISISDAKEGDLVFFNTRGGVSHVGVYLGNGYFVHSSTSSGVIISNLSENYYSNRFLSAGRITNEPEEN